MKTIQLAVLLAVGTSLLMAGCSRRANVDGRSLVAVPGKGIPATVELGMTFEQVDIGLGQKGERRSFTPWPNHDYNMACMFESLGVAVFGKKQEPTRIGQIRLYVDRANPVRLFRGSLSCGLSFKGERPVAREDITRVFGEPLRTFKPDDRAGRQTARMQGASLSVPQPASNGEFICYPTNGISFNLLNGLVVRVIIENKVEQLSGRDVQ